jgi:hypothetical protein
VGISARRGGSFTALRLALALAALGGICLVDAALFASGGTTRLWRRIRLLHSA